jgi:hypothetical protein
MIDILTPERFIAAAAPIASRGRDRRALAAAVALGSVGGAWRSSTARRSPTARPGVFPAGARQMRSAREAVAWTYGLPEQRYRPSVRT